LNHSKARHDPTSHGEVEAIRDACRRLECVDLSECELYSSCEPCAMCVATLTVAGVPKLYYAASMEQAGGILSCLPISRRRPIDADLVRLEAGERIMKGRLSAEQHRDRDAVAVLKDWAAK
jgi:guanine deaminase